MEKNTLDMKNEEIMKAIENGEIEVITDEQELPGNSIGFDIDVIAAHEEVSQCNEEEYKKGVIEVSKYIGQFHALINSGMDSDTAIVVMSWLREKELNDGNINMQLEMTKMENIKLKKEIL